MPKLLSHFRQTVMQALAHDVINTSKAAAYSGMLMLFPALLVVTTLVAQIQTGSTMLGELRSIYERFLPTDTLDLLQSYSISAHLSSDRLIFSAFTVGIFAALGVMLSLMEGFRRAYRLPMEDWGFWSRRLRALLLVPIALVPLSVATLVIVFGRQIEMWIVARAGHDFGHIVLFAWRIARLAVTFLTSTTVLASLYHFGTRRKEHWLWVAPGAVVGTLIWFPATLVYGWYVARISDYSMFYGSFAAGIATLVWLYITSFSVLMGAELNGVLYWDRNGTTTAAPAAEQVHSDSVEA